MKIYRQGDLLLIKEEPKQLNDNYKLDKTGIVLYGETTGHKHALKGNARLVRNKYNENDMYINSEGSQLVHEEHDTIELEEGFYRVIRQREFDEGEIRYVLD